MLIGIDWGGTKIEGVALTEDGKELTRRREPTPRHDYNGCIQLIAGLVQKIEQETGKTGSIGIGIPGSLDPKSRLGKGASSTWIIGKPVEEDLRKAIGREIRVENDADCFAASEAVDGAGAGLNVVYAVILGVWPRISRRLPTPCWNPNCSGRYYSKNALRRSPGPACLGQIREPVGQRTLIGS